MAKILLIESDKLLAANLQAYLKAAGHSSRWQVEPQAALNAVDSFKPDLLVMDLMLAGRSGAEFLYELRSYPDWENLPVIIYSSTTGGELGKLAPQGLEHLGIGAYHYKTASSLAELGQSIDLLLQPVKT